MIEDEIDLCLRWPDVPRAPRRRPVAYPTIPTLILQGGEDIRTPPEWSARIQARIPGRGPVRHPRRRPLDASARAAARSTRSRDFVRDAELASRCPRIRPASRGRLRHPRASRRCAATPALAQGRAHVTRCWRRPTTSGCDLPTSHATAAAACVAARGRSTAAGSPARLPGRDRRVTVSPGLRDERFRLRVAGTKAAHGTLTLASQPVTGPLGGRRISSRVRTGASAASRAGFRRWRADRSCKWSYCRGPVRAGGAVRARGRSGKARRYPRADRGGRRQPADAATAFDRRRRSRDRRDRGRPTALELARANPPDLALLDWMMPELSGLDVCRALRGDAKTAGAMIVIVTARADGPRPRRRARVRRRLLCRKAVLAGRVVGDRPPCALSSRRSNAPAYSR